MALKILPNDVQSLLCASAQVNSYKKAVEELVYNSLDAKATSIAIRIDIEESTIQVIDNGCGISKTDFDVLGQKYKTSKLVDLATLKAAPTFYGYRGEFLSNIITVSQLVKITSRYENTEETWAKTFQDGKEKKNTKMTTRPTKGTTVDVKGFLYNLNIQKRRIDPINEKQNIKAFLEQLSLVHNDISLSLRDDAKNEIIFKIHKKRDIYQTLLTLFDINKTDILELQVEKSEYKIKGLIGKRDTEVDVHWIFLNGKFIHSNSKLHKHINDHLKKYLHIKDKIKLKSKVNNDEHQLFNQDLPFYFVFITCPYYDYEYNVMPKTSVVEFKSWEQINKLLEKFVKLYVGDINLKEVKKPQSIMDMEKKDDKLNQDTRIQVKEIINKILGSNSKKISVSHLQKGVKGKLVKRKTKIKTKKENHLSKLLLQSNKIISLKNEIKNNKYDNHIEANCKLLNTEVPLNKIHLNEDKTNRVQKTKVNRDQIQKKKFKQKKEKVLKPKITCIPKKAYQVLINKKNLTRKQEKANKKYEVKQCQKTDSVCKESKIVAQEVEDFLRHYTKRKKMNKEVIPRKHADEIYNNLLLPPKFNKHAIDKNVFNKVRKRTFKTTYDLVQTIISQQDAVNAQKYELNTEHFRELTDHKWNEISHPEFKRLKDSKYIFDMYSNNNKCAEVSQYPTISSRQNEIFEPNDFFNKYACFYKENEINNYSTCLSENFKILSDDCKYNNVNSLKRQSFCSLMDPFQSRLTYESHQYQQYLRYNDSVNKHSPFVVNQNNDIRFITTQSKENFVTYDVRKKIKNTSKSIYNKQTKFYDKHLMQTIDESYTIEYSKSNENKFTKTNSNMFVEYKADLKDNGNSHPESNKNDLSDDILKSITANTYTISSNSGDYNIVDNQFKDRHYYSNFNKLFNTYSIHYSNSQTINNLISQTNTKTAHNTPDGTSSNIEIKLSKTDSENHIEPIEVCETVFRDNGTVEREFALSFNENNPLNDSLYGYRGNNGISKERFAVEPLKRTENQCDINIIENISHHFSNALNHNSNLNEDNVSRTWESTKENENQEEFNKVNFANHVHENYNLDPTDCNNFNLKNRLRFVPKGMSQIFEKCRSKSVCDFNLDKDYFEDTIYDNFVNDVQANTEIYEPIIQNVEDLTTKNLHKFQNKMIKDNASLIFDEKSLKEAKVLGQADCKFITVIMKNRDTELDEAAEHLILFDQHAVHERIRLEQNLADYVIEERWASVPLENIVLKMSKHEILYLHNYKDKFIQLGLQWTISNSNEVTINTIPQAILGKNPREVDKVIKAVRSLIMEEINAIKLQKGCVSLYPKSIMDLVFSEACRYAIKFGDPLTKNDCGELLKVLSDCKTPFQCAHGRPVMAVLMRIKTDKHSYKINLENLKRFRLKK